MDAREFKKISKKLPDGPGVYMFFGTPLRRGESHPSASQARHLPSKRGGGFPWRNVLYIGKATSLKDRVRSYFIGLSSSRKGADWTQKVAEERGPLIAEMLKKAKNIDFIETDSVLEALILEANLIKRHQPIYNTKEKSDKSFVYVVITDEEFPRILVKRGKELDDSRLTTGDSRLTKVNGQLSKVNSQPQAVYGPFASTKVLNEALRIIRKIFPFLGEKKGIKGTEEFYRQLGLIPNMQRGDGSPFKGRTVPPLAREYGRTIRNIKLLFEGKKKTLIKKLEKEMKELVKKEEFEKAACIRNQVFALQHINGVALIDRERLTLGVGSLTSGDPSPPIGGSVTPGVVRRLRESNFRIEAYDVAHMSGKSMVGVMTVVEDGEVQKSEYRKFKIRGDDGFGSLTSGDPLRSTLDRCCASSHLSSRSRSSNPKILGDTGALKEILERRFGHPEWKAPNIIVVDGGKAQKNTAERVLKKLDLLRLSEALGEGGSVAVVAVVKDERHRPREILGNKKLIRKFESDILLANSEAHRFSLRFHREKQRKALISEK